MENECNEQMIGLSENKKQIGSAEADVALKSEVQGNMIIEL